MKSKLKKLVLALSVTACISCSAMNAFAKDNIDFDNENIEVMVTVDTNMWKDKEGYYSSNKELLMVIPINTVIYLIDNPYDADYALCKYKDKSGNEIFGYVSKDNVTFSVKY